MPRLTFLLIEQGNDGSWNLVTGRDYSSHRQFVADGGNVNEK